MAIATLPHGLCRPPAGDRGRGAPDRVEHASSCMDYSGPGKDRPDSWLVPALGSVSGIACFSEAVRGAPAALERVIANGALAGTALRAMGGPPSDRPDRYRSGRA